MRERPSRRLRAAAATAVATLLIPGGAQALAPETADRDIGATAAAGFDAVILRPLGLAALAIGVAGFIPVAVLSSPGGRDSIESALEIFVTGPAHFVFKRPLGKF